MGLLSQDKADLVLRLVRQLEPNACFETLDAEFEKALGQSDNMMILWLGLLLAKLEADDLIWSESVRTGRFPGERYFYTTDGIFRRRKKEPKKAPRPWWLPLPLPT